MSWLQSYLLKFCSFHDSRCVSKSPVYALFLDARSAFDRVIKEILVRNLFLAGTDDQRLIYIDNRLANRKTYCQYRNELLGPIHDVRGLEQGGVSSSDQYKLYNNEQSDSSQSSGLGVDLGPQNVSCISLADDAILLSSDITNLKNLLYLTVLYCSKYNVDLVPHKTVLLAMNTKCESAAAGRLSSVFLNSKELVFDKEALHLGVLRSADCSAGNVPSIIDRLTAYRKQLFSLLPAGLALHHGGSPAANLQVEKMYCLPVLLSGLSTLVITAAEMNMITKYHKNVLRQLMKLPVNTPNSAVYLLAGYLPFPAYLHQRQLILFSMICHLEGNVIKNHAIYILTTYSSFVANSWFHKIRQICLQYGLPHPLQLLNNPLPKSKFKALCRNNIHEYWRQKICEEAQVPSLNYMCAPYLSLFKPHPIWTSLDGNPYQTKAAVIQASFLSGKYRTESVCRFWSKNTEGLCKQNSCKNLKIVEDIRHVLLTCSALECTRRRLANQTLEVLVSNPIFKPIVDAYLFGSDDDLRLHFLVDCSTLPMIISAYQMFGDIVHKFMFKISRNWCRSLHRQRLKLLGRHLG